MQQQIIVRTELFREGDVYVALCPDLDVSSFGVTIEEARRSLDEALAAFVEECEVLNPTSALKVKYTPQEGLSDGFSPFCYTGGGCWGR